MAGAHVEEKHVGPKVLSVSTRSPKVRTIEVSRPTNKESSFLAATFKGLGITMKHFAKNILLGDKNNYIETIQYPEETIKYPERYRGVHRLNLREDGSVRCVACMCCPTVCPANCITIIPEESGDDGIEKRPAVFEIDQLRCIACGLCVEACPCDAIRMDTGLHNKPVYERDQAVMNKEQLMALGVQSIATQGGEGADWRKG